VSTKREGLIAEAYFQRLLWDTQASEAVMTLAQFWSGRLREDAPQWGLSVPEHQVQLMLIYWGEVGNGGHAQYFMNRGIGHAVATMAALRAAGLDDAADVLGRACDVVGLADVGQLTPAAMGALHDLDLRVDEALMAGDEHMLALLREGRDLILLPERAG
jgi:hypothetical protein